MRKAGDVSFAEISRDREGIACFYININYTIIWVL